MRYLYTGKKPKYYPIDVWRYVFSNKNTLTFGESVVYLLFGYKGKNI